ncbi:MAG TPA: hypothetical protein V6D22_14505 [Candidatus Obscuribacterales bacterium]
MINDDLNRSRECLAACDELLNHCLAELDSLSQSLTDLRCRQKAEFGDLLLRTTLSHSLKALKENIEEKPGP